MCLSRMPCWGQRGRATMKGFAVAVAPRRLRVSTDDRAGSGAEGQSARDARALRQRGETSFEVGQSRPDHPCMPPFFRLRSGTPQPSCHMVPGGGKAPLFVEWTGEAVVDLTGVCMFNFGNPHAVITIFHSSDISAEDFRRACDAIPVGHVDPVDKHS